MLALIAEEEGTALIVEEKEEEVPATKS